MTDIEAPAPPDKIALPALLLEMSQRGASELHLKADSPPAVCVRGRLEALPGFPAVTADQTRQLATQLYPKAGEEAVDREVVGSIAGDRVRASIFRQRRSYRIILRTIASRVSGLEAVGVPEVAKDFLNPLRGLVLVCGAADSGCTTTLAALVDEINNTHAVSVVTIEDPIELLHKDVKAMVTQRQVGVDCRWFTTGIQRALRQNTGALMVSNIGDPETLTGVLEAAEHGPLVLAGVAARDTVGAINRLLGMVPGDVREETARRLARCLRGALAQTLVSPPSASRVPAFEVLIGCDPVREGIAEGRVEQLRNLLRSGHPQMKALDDSLADLVRQDPAILDQARQRAESPESFDRKVTATSALRPSN